MINKIKKAWWFIKSLIHNIRTKQWISDSVTEYIRSEEKLRELYEELEKEKKKMKQFNKSDLQNGMVAETREKYRYLLLNDTFINKDGFEPLSGYTDDLINNYNTDFDINKIYEIEGHKRLENIFDDSYLELLWQRPESLLTNKEKEYLNAIIKPFKQSVSYIKKLGTTCNGCEYEFITIEHKEIDKNIGYIYLPYFKKGTMYKNMEWDKEYTVEELGL